jgi:hypothetical protein
MDLTQQNPSQLSSIFTNYFQSIFTSTSSSSRSQSTHTTSLPRQSSSPSTPIPPQSINQHHHPIFDYCTNPFPSSQPSSSSSSSLPNPDLAAFTYSVPDLNELNSIIKKMRNNAASRPNGLSEAFYKASWHWVKNDIVRLVSDFYSQAFLPADLNQRFLTLIPKKPNPSSPQDYRPIGLCNVIYKIIVKSQADRVQPHLPNYISQAQSAFISGRHISSNVILTQEIIHSSALKSWTSQAFLLKIDLAKAFDRLE